MAFRKIKAGLVNADVDLFVGEVGNLFFDITTGELRLSNGVDPGGVVVSGGSGGYTLPTASTTTKGGVKVDGTTVTINNQIISATQQDLSSYATQTFVTTRGYLTSVGTISYNDLSNKPTIPTALSALSDVNITGTPDNGHVLKYNSALGHWAPAADLTGGGGGGLTLSDLDSAVDDTPRGNGNFTYNDTTGVFTYTPPDLSRYITSQFTFNVAADDSTLRTISSEETVKFVGAGGITTASDAEGAITITQGSTDQIIKVAGSFASDQSFKSEVIADLTDGVSISTWMGIPAFATEKTWQFAYNGNMTFPDSTVQTTAWTGTTSSLVNSTKTVSLGSDGVLTIPANGRISAASGYNLILGDGLLLGQGGSIFNENEDGLYLGGQNSDAGTYIQIPGRTASENSEPLIISHQWPNASIDILGGSGTWSFGTGGTLSLPNNGKISSGVNTAPFGSSFAYAQNAFGSISDTGGVFLPSDTNSRAIVAGYTLVSNAGVTLTVTSISIVAGPPSFVSVSTTPTASSFTYPVTVYSADYVAGYTAPEWQFGTNGSLTFPNGTTQTTAAESFSFSVAADDSTQRAISNNELIKFIGAGGITTASDTEGAITITQSAAAAGTLTGTELKSTVVTSSLTSVGTLTGLTVGGSGGDLTMTGGAITGVGNITASGILAVNASGGITTTQTSFDIVNSTATTVNIGGAATAVNIGAITGTLTLNNPTVVGTQTTATLFNTAATTVSAFGAATTSTIGATSGTMTLRNPTVVGTQTTVNLWNTTSTTVNAFGAATTVSIGAATGTLTLNNPTIVGSQTTQALFNTTATTVNFAGAATTLNIGTSSGITNIASAVKVGTGTFTKAGYATGDILLDNGSTDTPGLLMYYANNNNFAFDSWNGTFNILSGQLLRVVNNLNESGGAVKMAMDTTGNIVTTGFIQPSAWRPGQVIKDTMLNNSEFTVPTTTVATSNSDTDFITYSYTPTSSSSYLIIHVHVGAYSALEATGGGTDSYFSRIKVDNSEITYSRQYTRSGDSFRTGALFPLTGRYTNSDTTAKTITVGVRRDSADDNISIVNSSTALWMRITEIAR